MVINFIMSIYSAIKITIQQSISKNKKIDARLIRHPLLSDIDVKTNHEKLQLKTHLITPQVLKNTNAYHKNLPLDPSKL